MPNKNTQALNRLVKKLNALRKTLRKEERELLDQLIIGQEPEVAGHKMIIPTGASSAVTAAALAAKRQQAAEVEGHRMDFNAKREPKAANAVREPQAEVEGHQLTAPLAANAPRQAASAMREPQAEVEGHRFVIPTASSGPKAAVAIVFDAKKREYLVVPA